MKKSSLLVSLMVLASLVGCKAENSSSSSVSQTGSSPVSSVVTSSSEEASSSVASSSSSSSSEASSSSSEASSEASSSSSAVESSSSSSSSAVDSSSSSSSSSSSETSSGTSSDNSSLSNPEPVEEGILKDLKKGFRAKSTFAKSYDGGTPSITLIETFVGDGVTKWKQYSGKDWTSITENTTPYKLAQYQKDFDSADTDENPALSYIVTMDSAGKVVKDPLMLKLPLASKDVHAYWYETGLENAFSILTDDDFIKQDDGTYALDLSASKLADEDYVNTVNGLARQMYMVLEGYSTHSFISQSLTSYVLTVDENNVPVSYSATFEDYDSYGSTVSQSISGDFVGLGEGQVEVLKDKEAKYEELDEAFAKLKEQNYEFSISRYSKADGWYSYTDTVEYIDGKSDGKGNVEYNVKKVSNETSEYEYGYKQINETSYRTYYIGEEATVWDDAAVEGTVLTDILPEFNFSSAVFEKNNYSTAGLDVYRYEIPELINSNCTTDKTLLGELSSSWLLKDLVVFLLPDSIRFTYFTSNLREIQVEFSNFGGVSEINTTPVEFENVLAGTYVTTQNVKGKDIEFKFEFAADKTVKISVEGNEYGTFNYSYDDDQEIIIEGLEETDNRFTFTVETNGEIEGEVVTTTYDCYFYEDFEIDDPTNPSTLDFTFRVKGPNDSYFGSNYFVATKA